jgi:putative endonuclease
MAEHNELGKKGEALAKEFLIGKGYQILDINWRKGHLEVDIVAKYHSILVVFEVKTRNTDFFGTPESFVDAKKQNHLAAAVEEYIYEKGIKETELRYDVVSVLLNEHQSEIKHIQDAFFPDNLGLKTFDF